MRIYLILLVAISSVVQAQTVSDIKTTAVDEKIEISYTIPDSKNGEYFRISIICKTPDKNIRPKHITGDIGDYVEGGKDSYKATWDVLKDVDELAVAEFIIQVFPMNNGLSVNQNSRYITTCSGVQFTPLGIQAGIHRSWGVHLTARMGLNGHYISNGTEFDSYLYSFSVGASRKLLENFTTDLHAYAGIGTARWGDFDTLVEETTTENNQTVLKTTHLQGNDDIGLETNLGLKGHYKSLGYTIGLALNFGKYATHTDFLLGIGYNF